MKNSFTNMAPLVIFTTLLPAAIGLELGATISVIISSESPGSLSIILGLSLGLAILGAVFASLHLGKKARGIYAIRGIGHSFLSWESVFAFCFGAFLLLALLSIYSSKYESYANRLLIVSAIFGLLTALAIGKVYDLKSQATWKGLIPSLGPMLAALLFAGAILALLTDSMSANGYFMIALFTALALDIVCSIQKMKTFALINNKKHSLAYPQFRRWVMPCHMVKLILIISAVGALLAAIYELLLVIIGLAVLLDRIIFYCSAVQFTPETNISILKAERMRSALKDAQSGNN